MGSVAILYWVCRKGFNDNMTFEEITEENEEANFVYHADIWRKLKEQQEQMHEVIACLEADEKSSRR